MWLYITIAVICGVASSLIGERRGFDRVSSFVVGVLLGVFGVALIALWPAKPGTPPEGDKR